MESVIFDGKEYTKASVLAEKFRYTSDYLGQLCRGKKVDARLVGRAWYINLDSLLKHREARYKSQSTDKSSEISDKKAIYNYLSRIDIEPIVKHKTIRILMNQKGSVTELPVKYEGDDQALIPKVQKDAVSVSLPVNPADAERLKINKVGPGVASFTPEPLPEVYLKGSIKVVAIPEATTEETEEEKIEPKNKAISDVRESGVKTTPDLKKRVVTVRSKSTKLNGPESKAPSFNRPPAIKSDVKVAKPLRPGTFKPKLVVAEPATNSSGSVSLLRPLVAALLALVASFVILATSFEATVDNGVFDRGVTFSFENLRTLFR